MKKILISLGLVLFFGCLCLAQEKSFSINLSKDTLLFGNKLTISFKLNNLDCEFEAPDLSSLNIVSGPKVSTSLQYINGESTKSTSYIYYAEPNDIGAYTIAPAYLNCKDENYETDPLELLVVPNPDGIIEEDVKEDFFFEFPGFNFEFAYPDLFPKEKEMRKDTTPSRKLKRI